MAKVSSVEKNKHRISLVSQYKNRRDKLKEIIMNRDLSEAERFESTLKLASLPRNSAKNRVRNRCAISGRSRGYYRKFKLSRIALRNYASFGMIPGLVKSSW